VAAACVLAGSRLRGRLAGAGEDPLYRAVKYGIAGLLGLYLCEIVLFALGVPWSAAGLAAALAIVAGAAHLACRRLAAPEAGSLRSGPGAPGWGDGVALVCLAALAICAVLLWMVYSDFIFHWGIKGHHFFLARGFDYEFLSHPWNYMRHPEYPNFFPGLLAATAAVAGGFSEPAMMLWTAFFFFALLASGRETLRAAQASRPAAQATLALVALGMAMFGIGYTMGGSPDWVLALVPLAAWPLLLKPEERASDLALGLVAALSAAAKVEGLPLAAFLAAVYLARRGRGWWRAAPAVVLPTALVVGAWLAFGWRYGVLGGHGERELSLRYAGTIARAAFESLLVPEWHGAGFLVLVLPALIFCRPVRPAALVASLQLAFYAYVYLSAPHPSADGAKFFVQSNLPRLAFHLWPVAVVGCGVALDRWVAQGHHEGRRYSRSDTREPA
jgi:hypothetical protein